MQQLEFYISNQLVPPPDNWDEFEADLSFENTSPESILNENKLTWKGSNATILNNWFNGGITGTSPGIFEGLPFVVKICATQEVFFNGIIDITGTDTKWTCDIVTANIRDKRMDMINQLFDSVSFAFLATPTSKNGAGIINPTPTYLGGDYVVIPYQINAVPDYVEFFAMGLAIYNIADKIYEVIDTLGEIVTATTTDFGLGQVGGAILGILEIIGMILYLAAMILVIIDMLAAAFHYLVSPVFTKLGMYAHTLIERACQYFNIPFVSTILQTEPYRRAVIMPAKPSWASNQTFTRELFNAFMAWNGVQNRMQYDDLYNLQHNGFAYGFWDGTPGDLIRALEDVFNAKAKIIMNASGNPELHFERWDYQYNLASYTMANVSNDAPFKQPYGTNASEVAANYLVKYATDGNDLNSRHFFEGNSCYAQLSPIVYNDTTRRSVTLMHLTDKTLVFAQAFRKDKETSVEVVLGALYSVAAPIVNAIISLANTVSNIVNWVINLFCSSCPGIPTIPSLPAAPGWAATGHMLLSNNITDSPKIFLATTTDGTGTSNNWHGYTGVLIDPNNVATNQPSLAASMLMKYFHFASLGQTVAPGAPYTVQSAGSPYYNQWITYEGVEIPMCCADYHLIKNNNYITLFDGRKARVLSLKWKVFHGTALIDFRVRQQYTKNLKTSYVIDGAQTAASL